ncbi:hypothetical protein BDF22DRAFT_669962 [Syncephalis plumigaleata]|nr:hypothetical protein BDF22DRAFT_669962 [Syncephalis plumigaleata]
MNRLRRRVPEARTADTDEVEDSLSDYSEDTIGTASEEEEEEEEEEDIDSEEEDEVDGEDEDEEEEADNINDLDEEDEGEVLGTSNTEEDDSEATTPVVKPTYEKRTRAFLPSSRGRPARGRGGRGRYRGGGGGRGGAAIPPIHSTKRRGTGKPVPNRFRSNENAFEERQKVRNEYRRQLAEDPSFVPHIGTFWGHDDRFMPDGLRNRPRGGRGQFRGSPSRGFYGGRGASRGRGYTAAHASATRTESHPNDHDNNRRMRQLTSMSDKSVDGKVTTPAAKSSSIVNKKEGTQSTATPSESTSVEQKPTVPVDTPPTLDSTSYNGRAEKKQWDHDGYVELERESQPRHKRVQESRDRRPPIVPTSFRGTGRGRPFRGRGGGGSSSSGRGSAPWRGGATNTFRGQRRGAFRGGRGMGREPMGEPIERLPSTTKTDQPLYKSKSTRDIQTITARTTTADTVVDTEQVKGKSHIYICILNNNNNRIYWIRSSNSLWQCC